jgi:hypothetical protein
VSCVSEDGAPVVELLYTRGWVLWDEGIPGRGGYYARLRGFGDQGEGRTVDQALGRLAGALHNHVENWDAEVDEYAHARRALERLRHLEEPALVTWARRALRSGQLLKQLQAGAQQQVFADE